MKTKTPYVDLWMEYQNAMDNFATASMNVHKYNSPLGTQQEHEKLVEEYENARLKMSQFVNKILEKLVSN